MNKTINSDNISGVSIISDELYIGDLVTKLVENSVYSVNEVLEKTHRLTHVDIEVTNFFYDIYTSTKILQSELLNNIFKADDDGNEELRKKLIYEKSKYYEVFLEYAKTCNNHFFMKSLNADDKETGKEIILDTLNRLLESGKINNNQFYVIIKYLDKL